jgi:mRNA interferase RelE/StbE
MEVKIDNKAIKDLSQINKNIASNIFLKIEKLADFPQGTNIKKLTNFHPPYRLRVGDYRIFFDVEDDILTIYQVKHRKDCYK